MQSRLFGADDSTPSASVANFNNPSACFAATWSSTENNRSQVCPSAMDLSELYVELETAPGAGTSYTFTIMKNAVATTLEVVISDAATSAQYAGAAISFAQGDRISLRSTPANTPGGIGRHYWNMLVATAGQFAPLLGAGNASASNSAVSYMSALGAHNTAWVATETDFQIVVPTGGSINNLFVKASGTPGGVASYDIALMVNGVASALTCQIAGVATTANDVIDSVNVIRGDVITIRSTPTGTPSARALTWGMQFNPTTDGETFFGFGSTQVPSAAGVSYEQPLAVGSIAYSGTENLRYIKPGASSLRKLTVLLGTAPGAGTSRIATLRQNGASSIAEITISDLNTTGQDNDSVTFDVDDNLGLLMNVSGSPAVLVGGVHLGIVSYIAPAGSSVLQDVIGGFGIVPFAR